MNNSIWNPWHGCTKVSEGCYNCYVYRTDAKFGKDSRIVTRTSTFSLPLQRKRDGSYKLQPNCDNIIYTCFTSDFLHEAADGWRDEAWSIIRQRSEANFLFITKRITRLEKCLPADWGDGYPNVIIGCTVENMQEVKNRLPTFISSPIKTRLIICEPLLGQLDLNEYLNPNLIDRVIAGGESGPSARICDYNWIVSLREQCEKADVPFQFKQTGAKLKKDGKVYIIPREYQHSQARKANVDYDI